MLYQLLLLLLFFCYYCCCLYKNLNASRPSEHLLDRERGKVSKRIVGGIIDRKDKLFLAFSVLGCDACCVLRGILSNIG